MVVIKNSEEPPAKKNNVQVKVSQSTEKEKKSRRRAAPAANLIQKYKDCECPASLKQCTAEQLKFGDNLTKEQLKDRYTFFGRLKSREAEQKKKNRIEIAEQKVQELSREVERLEHRNSELNKTVAAISESNDSTITSQLTSQQEKITKLQELLHQEQLKNQKLVTLITDNERRDRVELERIKGDMTKDLEIDTAESSLDLDLGIENDYSPAAALMNMKNSPMKLNIRAPLCETEQSQGINLDLGISTPLLDCTSADLDNIYD